MQENKEKYAETLISSGGPNLVTLNLPPIANLVYKQAVQCGSWSEALLGVRESAKDLRVWLNEIVLCLKNGDGKGITQLKKTKTIMNLWEQDPDEGVKYITRKISIGNLNKYISTPFEYEIKDRIIWKSKHIVLLNQIFKNMVSYNPDKIKHIKL